jgi:hypothetical protein
MIDRAVDALIEGSASPAESTARILRVKGRMKAEASRKRKRRIIK